MLKGLKHDGTHLDQGHHWGAPAMKLPVAEGRGGFWPAPEPIALPVEKRERRPGPIRGSPMPRLPRSPEAEP